MRTVLALDADLEACRLGVCVEHKGAAEHRRAHPQRCEDGLGGEACNVRGYESGTRRPHL